MILVDTKSREHLSCPFLGFKSYSLYPAFCASIFNPQPVPAMLHCQCSRDKHIIRSLAKCIQPSVYSTIRVCNHSFNTENWDKLLASGFQDLLRKTNKQKFQYHTNVFNLIREKGSYWPHTVHSVKVKSSLSSTNSVCKPSREENSKMHFWFCFLVFIFLRRRVQIIIVSCLKDLL